MTDPAPAPVQVSFASAGLSEPLYATMTARFCAYVLDSILIGAVVKLAGFPPLIGLLCFMVYRFLAHSVSGSTLGKYILGIEVNQVGGSKMPRPVAMLLRDTVGFVISSLFFGMGYWWGHSV
jgi:hypothetical protein